MEETVLQVRQLKKYYPWKKNKVKAVDGVEFDIKKGEMVSIVGESGCGKSTLARCIIRLEEATGGQFIFDGEDITFLEHRKMRPVYEKMQMVFQNPYAAFNPRQSIGAALKEVGHFYKMKSDEIDKRIETLLSYVNISGELLTRYSRELSGGQLQRLAIARALMVHPQLLIADEAVSALDVSVQAQILNILMDIKEKENMSVLFISHDLAVVEHISDQVLVMYLGKIVESGSQKRIFEDPIHPYTRALLASRPREVPWENSKAILLKGDLPSALDLPKGCRFGPRCPNYRAQICGKTSPQLTDLGNGHKVACHFI